MRSVLGALLLTVLLAWPASAQSPKREFRGAWIATVINLDWPSRGASAADQQASLVFILDGLKASGINAVVFQVRPEADAFYRSDIEPWSYYLTGQQGRDPGYDPLAFAIEEAHKRGMELHAWFNPYRTVRETNTYPKDPKHLSVKHPEWLLTFTEGNGNILKIVDPGLQAVRDYTAGVVADVVRRYDVDGVHFDDYFYPYPGSGFPGITTQDNASCAADPRCAQLGRGNWRRDNINRFVRQVADSILAIKPTVKFGISPFGIWKSGTPAGITGLDAYNAIYADAVAWLQQGSLDYLTPQLYWRFGGNQDYATLAPWWRDVVNFRERHLYPGLITTTNENPRQIRFNRANGIPGYVLFRAGTVLGNPAGVNDSLRRVLNVRPALPPVMPWKGDLTAPRSPSSFRQLGANDARITLTWRRPDPAADGDTARFYALYRFPERPVFAGAPETSEHLVAVFGGGVTTYTDTPPRRQEGYYYVLTALDENWNESPASSEAFAVAAEGEALASGVVLEPPFPNPARGPVTLRYRLDAPARVRMAVYDALGRRVADLDAVDAPAGARQVVFDSAAFSPGLYVIRLTAGGRTVTRSLTVPR